ncbi:MAG: hypothetical protein M0R06_27110 [Sphaerochaeta sp.]|jgi:hypothetical protein|nr:hypothetical protein [Sphaerochaeta sp.]
MGFTGKLEGAKGFLEMEDLNGRLLVVSPQSVGERASTLKGQEGKMYEYVVCDIVVCDGEPDDRIGDSIPGQLDAYQLAGMTIVGQLKPKVGKGKLVVGRLGQQPSKTKGFGKAWVLQNPTPDELRLAQESLNKIQTEAAQAPADDPFATS